MNRQSLALIATLPIFIASCHKTITTSQATAPGATAHASASDTGLETGDLLSGNTTNSPGAGGSTIPQTPAPTVQSTPAPTVQPTPATE